MSSLSAAILVATCTATFGLHSSSSATISYSYFAFASALRSLTARSVELRPPMPLAETPPVSGPIKPTFTLSFPSTSAAAIVTHSAAIPVAASLPDLVISSSVAFMAILRRPVRTIVARCGPQDKGKILSESGASFAINEDRRLYRMFRSALDSRRGGSQRQGRQGEHHDRHDAGKKADIEARVAQIKGRSSRLSATIAAWR